MAFDTGRVRALSELKPVELKVPRQGQLFALGRNQSDRDAVHGETKWIDIEGSYPFVNLTNFAFHIRSERPHGSGTPTLTGFYGRYDSLDLVQKTWCFQRERAFICAGEQHSEN